MIPRLNKTLEKKFEVLNNTYIQDVKSKKEDKIEVEIGDIKQKDFKPQFKIKRWDNEVNFSMRAKEHREAKVETAGEKIKYITPEYEVHQYDKPKAGEDGGFEFEWVLNKKPETNILCATIETKGLDFFYQPELTEEEIKEKVERPDNIIGSYAVYHKTKKNNIVGGKEYKTGKAFHIYRPQAIDASGVKVWCDLHIDIDLVVTVPQDFLDNASYPVIIDPTFGYASIGGSNASYSNRVYGSDYSLSEPGTLDYITSYIRGVSSLGRIRFVIYDSSNNLVDYSPEFVINSTAEWDSSVSLQNFASLNIGTYRLCLWVKYTYMYFDSGSTGYIDTETYSSSAIPPNPFTLASTADAKISIYATYTAGGVASNIKSVNGIAQTDIKSVNAILSENLKSVNGVTN